MNLTKQVALATNHPTLLAATLSVKERATLALSTADPAIMKALAAGNSYLVRDALIQNHNLTPEALAILTSEKDWVDNWTFAARVATTAALASCPRAITALLKARHTAKHVAGNAHVIAKRPSVAQRILRRYPDAEMRAELCKNPSVAMHANLVEALAPRCVNESENYDIWVEDTPVALALAKNTEVMRAHPRVAERLAAHSLDSVRLAVASGPAVLHANVARTLASNASRAVRVVLSNNPFLRGAPDGIRSILSLV